MPLLNVSNPPPRKNGLASFTLVEMLVVIAIIAILAAFVLQAGIGVMKKAARNRATNEIAGMGTALEGYKTDNGIYPPSDGTLLLTNTYAANDGTMTAYQTNSQLLYQALTGQTNYNDIHLSQNRSYMTFKINQLGNYAAAANTTGSGTTYIKDPWGYSYGYSTATNAAGATPYTGNNNFDLWSTGGVLKAQVSTTPSLTNAWIVNW